MDVHPAPARDPRPVLYLDVDDVLVDWAGHTQKAAVGGRDFLIFALEHFEVRWLTRRCPGGEMPELLVEELAALHGLDPALLTPIRGLDWSEGGSKLNGIAWIEHLVLGRAFVWVEDENGVRDLELRVLADAGLTACYHHCNVSTDPQSLVRALARLAAGMGVALATSTPT